MSWDQPVFGMVHVDGASIQGLISCFQMLYLLLSANLFKLLIF